ncbi:hypothetical protein [Streptomyces nanshensis]|uniref:Uncharacterized protein n=1 Tax=Streptomyces nanshensis TaxID=518642 RepID=A0A1E7LAK5_9ACTN|nr:hypothetical protein [Streptomyces nanshensis]OEV13226.1 hypothetical protein AN218_04570 [Streptomyces nanshensis]
MSETPNTAPVAMTLPPVPDPTGGDGYDWMAKLDRGWRPVAGIKGTMIGDWPYVVVAHYDSPATGAYGVTVYLEGDVETHAYTSRTERDRHTVLKYAEDAQDEGDGHGERTEPHRDANGGVDGHSRPV